MFQDLSFCHEWEMLIPNLTVIHIPVSSGPLAWTFVAMLSNGAAMVNACDVAAKVIANVAVWSILVYGLYFLVIFGDYTIGFEMSWLSLGKICLGVLLSV